MTSHSGTGFVNQNSTAPSGFQRGILSRLSGRLQSQRKPSVPKESTPVDSNWNPYDFQSDLNRFKLLWHEVRGVMNTAVLPLPSQNGNVTKPAAHEPCEQVISLTLEMVKILTKKVESNNTVPQVNDSRILDYFYSEEVLEKLLHWASCHPEFDPRFRIHLLAVFSNILDLRSCQFFMDLQILKPLFRLILSCAEMSNEQQLEENLAMVLNHLCFGISQYSEVLEAIFSDKYMDTAAGGDILITALLGFIHWDGAVGQQARDALQVIICLSATHLDVAGYIVARSNLCPVLAAGLTGLYSSLPRTLASTSDDWSGISDEDIDASLELQRFLTALMFCNDVIKVSPPSVRQHLLELIYNGFLVPVIAPGLHQGASGVEEVIATTAYLNLFLSKITDPLLLRTFLKFILLVKVDEFSILDILIQRVSSLQTKLCVVTLVLFRTLVDLNCEDVMYSLVFKYLIPCTHVMVSQQQSIENVDFYSKNTQKLLSLVPACCTIEAGKSEDQTSSINALCDVTPFRQNSLTTPEKSKWWHSIRRKKAPPVPPRQNSVGNIQSTMPPEPMFESSYIEYLHEARNCLNNCRRACQNWSRSYDVSKSLQKHPERDKEIGNLPDVNCNSHQSVEGVANPIVVSPLDVRTGLRESEQAAKGELQVNASRISVETSSSFSRNSHLSGMNFSDDLGVFLNQLNSVLLPELSDNLDKVMEELDAKLSSPENRANNVHNEQIAAPTSGPSDSTHLAALQNVTSRTNEESRFQSSNNFQKTDKRVNEESGFPNSNDFQKTEVHKDQQTNSEDVHGQLQVDISDGSRDQSAVVRPHNLSLPLSDGKQQLLLTPSPVGTPRNLSVSPTIGPFLTTLLQRLESMRQNTFYINLHLTGLITRLACYPQPLLSSLLLSQTLVFQPSVKSLAQVLNTIKCRLEEYLIKVTEKDVMMMQALHYLQFRDGQVQSQPRLSLDNARLAQPRPSLPKLTLLGSRHGARYVPSVPAPAQSPVPFNSPDFVEKKNAIYGALVLKEFLKELAAISQEHTMFRMMLS